MRSVTKYGIAATGVAAAIVVAPLPAMAAEDTDSSTGTVTVTRFDDRYADGVFDQSKTARDGWTDVKNTNLSAWLVASDNSRHYGYTTASNDYIFENVPVGPAKVYLYTPNNPAGEVLFDATGAESADDIVRLPFGSDQGMASGVLSVDVDADGEQRLVGMSALRVAADVRFADGSIATGLTGVEFGSGDDWYNASEYQFNGGYGTYEAFESFGYVRHIPDELGVRIAAPAGYRVASVTADDYVAIPVTQHDGAYWIDAAAASSYFAAPKFTITLEAAPDTTRPEATLVAPTTAGPAKTIDLKVDATDDRGLGRIVANIYKDGTLVKSTQTAVNGATSGSHTATVTLPDGKYTIRYNASDLAGNVSQTRSFDVTVDGTAPTVTVKDGASYTVGDANAYGLVSFKLYDAGKIDKVTINGKVKDLTDNAWSDVNYVKPGTFGAVEGANTLVVYDVAGNTTTLRFTLDGTGPQVTVKEGVRASYDVVGFKLYDAVKVDKVSINGVVKDLSNSQWSDVNGVKPGVFGAVKGENTLVAYDVLGNTTTVGFTLN
ncbi:Ig-like domain-containing protein [Herbiconiux sp. L3-i23]|uniref:Ig-like domain-containing protein n=1 Tax=Herbiconiux sp. L3-i23 TaxID=2905871 RepID=UPI002051754F|nr:Ig-like domain-containing protein [Herbiconiux sp. L3-i23]BDI23384.1 hypothetical protein L3i23_21600 [Herbiconiux sp. L3-i23]